MLINADGCKLFSKKILSLIEKNVFPLKEEMLTNFD